VKNFVICLFKKKKVALTKGEKVKDLTGVGAFRNAEKIMDRKT
jgi:hypothetical protein